MAKTVLTNCGLYLAGYELSGYANKASIDADTEQFDVSTFGNTYREFILGQKSATFSAAGIYDPLNVDAVLNAKWGSTDEVFSILATNATAGISYFFQGAEGKYSVGGGIGRPGEWSMNGLVTSSPLVRGNVLHRTTTVAATGTGTAQQLGTVSASQSIYGALHVFSIAGTSTPTVTVKIQSDNASNFPSATDRLTFTAKTAIGAEWKTAGPGAITDDYWRAQWTVTGSSPVFGFVVSFGIQ